MSKNLFVTTVDSRSGKSVIVLGIMEFLVRNIEKVALFRPIINNNKRAEKDGVILSRGCLIPDIVNTIAITAIQAQAKKGLL